MRIKLQVVSFLTVVLTSWFFLASCSSVNVRVLPGIPQLYEKMPVYGIAYIDKLSDQTARRLAEKSCDTDAGVMAASLTKGMYFVYNKNAKNPIETVLYRQSAWGELKNFEIQHYDRIATSKQNYILAKAQAQLLYDMDDESFQAIKKGVAVETTVEMPADAMLSLRNVVKTAVKQTVEFLYEDEIVKGSVWVLEAKPLLEVKGTLDEKAKKRYIGKDVYLVPTGASDYVKFKVKLVLRRNYKPPTEQLSELATPNIAEVAGTLADEDKEKYVAPGFAFDFAGKNAEAAKKLAKERALAFFEYVCKGFEFLRDEKAGVSIKPRADRKSVSPDFVRSVENLPSAGEVYIGKASAEIAPFRKPVVPPSKYNAKITFPIENNKNLKQILDLLPKLLINDAIKQYGGYEGMGYFGKSFDWRIFRDEKTGVLKFEIGCEIYIHIKLKKQN